MTVSLRNVPWDQALDLVLKTKGLDKEELGNVIRIARLEDIAKEQEARGQGGRGAQAAHPAQGPAHPGQLRPRRRRAPGG
ncbi:MAG: secretin and TonB N-terminal domain-containing protein [Ignavibacteriales bacterium]|nr:secretin and TonB N-terminal domain-containing protein [Ignavibacteriales bacterium]